MVSPFIFMQGKQVMEFLLREQRPFILLVDNGFRDYYKPSDALFLMPVLQDVCLFLALGLVMPIKSTFVVRIVLHSMPWQKKYAITCQLNFIIIFHSFFRL